MRILGFLWRLIQRRRFSYAEKKLSVWKREAIELLRELSAANRKLISLSEEWTKEVERSERNLDGIASRVKDMLDRSMRLKEQSENVVNRHDETLEAMSAELHIFKEGAIPAQILVNESMKTQIETVIALLAQYQAAISPRREE